MVKKEVGHGCSFLEQPAPIIGARP
jgi:hypothetical protein